jgi:RNA polymerase sigma-70 factor (ECF subfamily)
MISPVSIPSQTDTDLLARYAAGDPLATRLLTESHVPQVHALARRMLADDEEAEDVTQEAMLRLWKQAPFWRPDGALVSTWLYRVTANLCIDRLRRRRETSALELPEPADPAPAALERISDSERAAALEEALATLPDRQRLAIVLRHLEDRPNPEIAAVLNTSIEAVESLLARGRRTLAARLRGMDIEPEGEVS